MRYRAGAPTEERWSQQHRTGGTGSQSSRRYARSHRRSERRHDDVSWHSCSRDNEARRRQVSTPCRLERNSNTVQRRLLPRGSKHQASGEQKTSALTQPPSQTTAKGDESCSSESPIRWRFEGGHRQHRSIAQPVTGEAYARDFHF